MQNRDRQADYKTYLEMQRTDSSQFWKTKQTNKQTEIPTGFTLPDFKTLNCSHQDQDSEVLAKGQTYIGRTDIYWWDRTVSRSRPHTYAVNWFLTEMPTQFNGERKIFNKWYWNDWLSKWSKMNLYLTIHKNWLEMDHRLQNKCSNYKAHKSKQGESLFWCWDNLKIS